MTPFSIVFAAAAAAIVYYLCPGRFQWIVLLAVSCLMYAQNGIQPLCFLLLTAMTTWVGALMIGRIADRSKNALRAMPREERKAAKARVRLRQRIIFLAVLLLNFGILALTKYFLPTLRSPGLSFRLLVPLGISFYTFQSTGYLIDVYQGKYAPQTNPAKFLLFVSFFPQLIQGPIGRYDHLSTQFFAKHKPDPKTIRFALMLILWGFFKKKVIADRAADAVEAIFSAAGAYGGAISLVGVLLYSLQQYADFSGGIDLAIGAAELLDIRLTPNFRRPYFSVSLGDFWRRWHISLGAWMRDYIFYPFALSKPMKTLSTALKKPFGPKISRAMPAVFGNILIFLIVGIWHGASGHYVVWGLYNGVILAVSALLEPSYKAFGEKHASLVAFPGWHVFRVLRTFAIVNIGWFFDRSETVSGALSMLAALFTRPTLSEITDGTLFSLGLTRGGFALLALCALILFAVSYVGERYDDVREKLDAAPLPLRWGLLYALMAFTVLFAISGQGAGSFMYAMF